MSGVSELGYLGLGVRNLEAWRRLSTHVLGCEVQDNDTSDGLDLRLDGRPFRIRLFEGPVDALLFLGFGVPGAKDLAAIANAVEGTGADVERVSTAEAMARGVAELIRFDDPSGFACEVYHGAEETGAAVNFARPIAGFVTGRQGLGHAVLVAPNYKEMVEFYTSVLGFRISDHIDLGGVGSTFLHCNPRHHTLAILQGEGAEAPRLHHFMLELVDLDDVGTALDLCVDNDFPIALTLGRHTNDKMTSFYLETPSGWLIEYGHGGLAIDDSDAWKVGQYDSPSIWGHRPPSALTSVLSSRTEPTR